MGSDPTTPTLQERELLEAARAGDEDAYRLLVEPHRRELHAHCYRMLGSVQDAEDALQEALLRAWRGLPRFEGRSSLRSWLYRIATNTCLDAIARRPKRVLPIDYGPGHRPARGPRRAARRVGLDRALPGRDAGPRGRLRRARGPLRAARERRARLRRGAPAPARQPARRPDPARGARLLGPGGGRVARHDHRLGEQRPAARARRSVEERLPEQSQQATLRDLGDDGLREIVDAYVDAWERGDVDDGRRRCWPRTPRSRCRRCARWFHGREALSGLPRRLAALGRLALASRSPPAPTGSRRSPSTAGTRRRARTCPSRSTCSPSAGGRSGTSTAFITRVHRAPRPRGLGAVAGAAGRPRQARRPSSGASASRPARLRRDR